LGVATSNLNTIAAIRAIGRRIDSANTIVAVLVSSIARERIGKLEAKDVVAVETIALQRVNHDCSLKSIFEISET
jgi:hypothetical protein